MNFQLQLQCSTVAETHGQVQRQWPSIETALLNRCRHTWTGAQAMKFCMLPPAARLDQRPAQEADCDTFSTLSRIVGKV